MERAVISLEGVRFGYRGGRRGPAAIACDRLALSPGVALLVGPNGAGKSTLLKLMAGVERPETGTITILGHDLWREEVAARLPLAYLPEHPDLSPYTSLGAVLDLVASLRGAGAGAGAAALERVGLRDQIDRSVRELSMGQRRRAVLAAALIGSPAVLLLDEPLEAMDHATRHLILEWLEARSSEGATVVVATHVLAPFATMATAMVTIREGRVGPAVPLVGAPAERLSLLERNAAGEASGSGRYSATNRQGSPTV